MHAKELLSSRKLEIFFGFLIAFTFETLFFSGLIYIILIPISYFHYKQKNKSFLRLGTEEETEDIL